MIRISVISLIVLLCSFIAHSQHIYAESQIVEQQECHVCNQSLDSPPKGVAIVFSLAALVLIHISWTAERFNPSPYNGHPQLRAPPQFSRFHHQNK